MKVKGVIASGVHRGESLIDKYHYRLIGILGFEPWDGTLNVHVDSLVDIKKHATKKIEHLLIGGIPHIEAYVAHVKLRKDGKEVDCWCLCQEEFHKSTILELIAKDNLKETMKLHDGDTVEIEFVDFLQTRQSPAKAVFETLTRRERH